MQLNSVINDQEENSEPMLSALESIGTKPVSVVLLGASEERRRHLADVLAGSYVRRQEALPDREEISSWVVGETDALIVDLEGDPEAALQVVEAACGQCGSLTVMVYSRQANPALILRAMRAGAREFLTDPLTTSSLAEALVRAAVRRDESAKHKATGGKLLIFAGAKGGSGVTTLAANFALLLTKESGKKVVLADLDLHLGDTALSLGITNQFSTSDALKNERRLDSDLLATMLVEHSSGLRVLAAADRPDSFHPSAASVAKLIATLRSDFAYTVVDAGSDYPDYILGLFESADKIYLVTQVSVVELRNCHRLMAAHFGESIRPRLQVVLNRYAARAGEIDEASITKALTLPPAWRVPGDFRSARQAQNTAAALALKDGPITRAITEMARAACGTAAPDIKKRRFGFF
jgi:pilus assembly protein CpaE